MGAFYVKGKTTVALNTSGAVLMLPLRAVSGRMITLHPRKGKAYVDVEDACEEKQVRAALQDLEELTRIGKISWHARGARPAAPSMRPRMRMPQREGESVAAPSNEYDRKLNELIEREKMEDDRTKASTAKRDLTRDVQAPSPISAGGPPQTRFADASKGEVDAADLGPTGADLTRPAAAGPYDATPVGELVAAALSAGAMERKGSWYRFAGENVGNGEKAACEALEADAPLLARLRAAMNDVTVGSGG